MKKEDKHNCPTDFIYSKKHGRYINPNLEVVDGNDYPERRNHSASNLNFSTNKKKGKVI